MDSREFLNSLEQGKTRVAEKQGNTWVVNTEVKEKILELFKNNPVVDMPGGFRDKKPFSPRVFTEEDGVRMVPGGSSVRPGTYIAKNVVIMPPSYINIGAYVDEGTMVDSHALVGSCAQVGKRVHLSAAVQLGGVLEPIRNNPVIIEDDCFIGAGSIIVEGVLVRTRAVIASGVQLSASVPIYDMVNNKVYTGEVPEDAVVVSGTRAIANNESGVQLYCAVIVKYRDSKTDVKVALESALRAK